MKNEIIVKNWTQVWKSLAVWLPGLATAIYAFLEYHKELENFPVQYLPFVVIIMSGLGWIKKQPSIRK